MTETLEAAAAGAIRARYGGFDKMLIDGQGRGGLQAGMTHVNDSPVNDLPACPFGGEKNSGIGRSNEEWAIEEFSTVHWVSVRHAPIPLSVLTHGRNCNEDSAGLVDPARLLFVRLRR